MNTMVAKKSYRKRIKVTKTGKLLRRKQGLGHARAGKPRRVMLHKKERVEVHPADRKVIAFGLGEPARAEENDYAEG